MNIKSFSLEGSFKVKDTMILLLNWIAYLTILSYGILQVSRSGATIKKFLELGIVMVIWGYVLFTFTPMLWDVILS
jgi:hypothetical protein